MVLSLILGDKYGTNVDKKQNKTILTLKQYWIFLGFLVSWRK